MKNNLKILFAILSLQLWSCSDQNEITTINGLDLELKSNLEKSSGGNGITYYLLPESNDFGKIPQDPKNILNASKVELGKLLFHETATGQNPRKIESFQTYSCASCHHAKAGFQACVAQGIGDGGLGFGLTGERRVRNPNYKSEEIDVQPIRSPSALNIAYQANILWNGQFGATHQNIGTEKSWTKGTPKATNEMGFQGVETQAIAGRDVHRLIFDRILFNNFSTYKNLFVKAFDNSSINNKDELKKNASLAIAAYERTLLANQAPFQQWLRGNKNAMTESEKKGAILFFGKAECSSCHNGPSLANMEFHAIGMKDLHASPYTVHNSFAGNSENKGRGGFTGKDEDMFKFKVPQLYNLKDSPIFGHGASFFSIEAVLNYKNIAKKENPNVPDSQLSEKFKPLKLSNEELKDLTAFIKNGLYDPNLMRYVPKTLPSGLAFPNNDNQSRIDLGF